MLLQTFSERTLDPIIFLVVGSVDVKSNYNILVTAMQGLIALKIKV